MRPKKAAMLLVKFLPISCGCSCTPAVSWQHPIDLLTQGNRLPYILHRQYHDCISNISPPTGIQNGSSPLPFSQSRTLLPILRFILPFPLSNPLRPLLFLPHPAQQRSQRSIFRQAGFKDLTVVRKRKIRILLVVSETGFGKCEESYRKKNFGCSRE
ncbi:hypothetical protein BGZ57DRAFT_911426 [Hyaloscypha finlandica]|nr:hypothetical protein BGZ57DRAFT_911426 [Hyaloscypha finlandica]